jgi:hypothetical protein
VPCPMPPMAGLLLSTKAKSSRTNAWGTSYRSPNLYKNRGTAVVVVRLLRALIAVAHLSLCSQSPELRFNGN